MVRGRVGWTGGLPVDVAENDNELIVRASLPGLDPEDINISVEGDMLTIRGELNEEKEEQRGQYHLRERQYGSFSRTISLPTRVSVDQANAEFKNGVLTLTLPKAEEVKPKLIKVQGNGHKTLSAPEVTDEQQGSEKNPIL
jgi:HSP20 family protein